MWTVRKYTFIQLTIYKNIHMCVYIGAYDAVVNNQIVI